MRRVLLILALLGGCGARTDIGSGSASGGGHVDAGAADVGVPESIPAFEAASFLCGDGRVDADEECDEGADNGRTSSCCDVTCHARSKGSPCRLGSGDTCDPGAVCDGERGVCPPNVTLDDRALCSGNGGDTCCHSRCVAGPGGPGTCDPCELPSPAGARVAIIDDGAGSASTSPTWRSVAEELGLSVAVVPISTLDALDSLHDADVLIVTALGFNAKHVATIHSFVESGRGLYLQTSWNTGAPNNQAFARLIADLGGTFTWGPTVTGQLTPTVLGCWSSYPRPVAGLSYFWWGAESSVLSSNVEPIVVLGTQALGFSFCPTPPGQGQIVTVTDEDWITHPTLAPEGRDLMANIIARLVFAQRCR